MKSLQPSQNLTNFLFKFTLKALVLLLVGCGILLPSLPEQVDLLDLTSITPAVLVEIQTKSVAIVKYPLVKTVIKRVVQVAQTMVINMIVMYTLRQSIGFTMGGWKNIRAFFKPQLMSHRISDSSSNGEYFDSDSMAGSSSRPNTGAQAGAGPSTAGGSPGAQAGAGPSTNAHAGGNPSTNAHAEAVPIVMRSQSAPSLSVLTVQPRVPTRVSDPCTGGDYSDSPKRPEPGVQYSNFDRRPGEGFGITYVPTTDFGSIPDLRDNPAPSMSAPHLGLRPVNHSTSARLSDPGVGIDTLPTRPDLRPRPNAGVPLDSHRISDPNSSTNSDPNMNSDPNPNTNSDHGPTEELFATMSGSDGVAAAVASALVSSLLREVPRIPGFHGGQTIATDGAPKSDMLNKFQFLLNPFVFTGLVLGPLFHLMSFVKLPPLLAATGEYHTDSLASTDKNSFLGEPLPGKESSTLTLGVLEGFAPIDLVWATLYVYLLWIVVIAFISYRGYTLFKQLSNTKTKPLGNTTALGETIEINKRDFKSTKMEVKKTSSVRLNQNERIP